MSSHQHYIVKDPVCSCFKKGDLILAKHADYKCGFNKHMLTAAHWKLDECQDCSHYCECLLGSKLKSLENTWWKLRNYHIHFKIKNLDGLYFVGNLCESDTRKHKKIKASWIFERYTLCEQS